MKAHVGKNALCCWYAEVFPSCFCGGMFNLGTVFPKTAKTLLRSICVQSQSSFAQGKSSQVLPWASAGLPGCGDQWAFPAEQRLAGLLVVYPTQQSDVEITSSCSWQFDVSLGWSCKSLFCCWFFLQLACLGFAGCLWSLLQILLVVHAPWLPDPSLGFSSCFLLTLRLSSFGFLGPKCDRAFLFKPLAEPNSFFVFSGFGQS